MCIPGYWLAGFHTPAAPRRLQVPLGWGTLGYAFPAALGAALADAGPVVSISGDGGFLFACGELATMAQEQIPLTAVIVDDGGYGMLRYDQVRAGAETYGVDLHTPDFAALAARLRRPAPRPSTASTTTFGEALAEHVADPEPSRAGRAHPGPAGPAAQHLAELVPPAPLKLADNRHAFGGRLAFGAPEPSVACVRMTEQTAPDARAPRGDRARRPAPRSPPPTTPR